MGAELIVIPLAALFLPIVLVLTAVLVDFLILLWIAIRWGRDRVIAGTSHLMQVHLGGPISRFAHTHHLLPRRH